MTKEKQPNRNRLLLISNSSQPCVCVHVRVNDEESNAKLRDVCVSLRREKEIAKSSLMLEKNEKEKLELAMKKVSFRN